MQFIIQIFFIIAYDIFNYTHWDKQIEPLCTMKTVLVHGIFNTGRVFFLMKRILQKNGFDCYTPSLKPMDGRYGIEDLAYKLRDMINAEIGKSEDFILVGFSMGGIIARYYLQYLDETNRINYFFTIAAPHKGSYWAYLYPGKGTKQLRPNSNFLRDLKETECALNDIKLYSYRTPFDLSIVPSKNAYWAIAKNKKFFIPWHPLMVFSTKIAKEIITVINNDK